MDGRMGIRGWDGARSDVCLPHVRASYCYYYLPRKDWWISTQCQGPDGTEGGWSIRGSGFGGEVGEVYVSRGLEM